MQVFVQAVFDMHTKSGCSEAISAFKPCDPNNLGIDNSINVWGPAVITRIAKIRAKLDPENASTSVIL